MLVGYFVIVKKEYMSDKTKTLRTHASRRLRERYGLRYSDELLNSIKMGFRNGRCQCVHRQSIRIMICECDYFVKKSDLINDIDDSKLGLVKLRFAYDKSRHTIVTFLPNDEDLILIPKYSDELYD